MDAKKGEGKAMRRSTSARSPPRRRRFNEDKPRRKGHEALMVRCCQWLENKENLEKNDENTEKIEKDTMAKSRVENNALLNEI